MIFFVGVDPGISGAVGLLTDRGHFHSAFHMPVRMKRTGRREVDARNLHDTILALAGQPPHRLAFRVLVEQVTSMPGQGVAGTFSLGDSYGCARSVGALLPGARCATVAPVTWKKAMRLTSNKAWSLTVARDTFPQARALLERKKDEARAEALLLALYAYKHASDLYGM